MHWQLVASYSTVNSTDFFTVYRKQLAQFLQNQSGGTKLIITVMIIGYFRFLELLRYSNHTAYGTASGHSIPLNVVP